VTDSPKPLGYCNGHHAELLRAVPAGPLRLLDTGSGAAAPGVALKAHGPRHTVSGAERHPDAAARAAACLDRVFTANLGHDDLPLPDGLLFDDVFLAGSATS
jgi:hypothetical protein